MGERVDGDERERGRGRDGGVNEWLNEGRVMSLAFYWVPIDRNTYHPSSIVHHPSSIYITRRGVIFQSLSLSTIAPCWSNKKPQSHTRSELPMQRSHIDTLDSRK